MDTNWRPKCSIEALHFRAGLLRDTRRFFEERSVLEVMTPVLSRSTVSDPHIESFRTESEGELLYLQTSPEFFMKRLLAAGAPGIYQIAPAFRQSEVGRHHNHEFTMLEWYRPDFELAELMREVSQLIDLLIGPGKCSYLSVEQMFQEAFSVNPHIASRKELLGALESYHAEDESALLAEAHQSTFLENLDDAALFDLMFSMAQQKLPERVFLVDFPVRHAALAKVERNALGTEVARRFELIVKGVEIANGYLELLDPVELERRMVEDTGHRADAKKHLPLPDSRLLAAMRYGLPACSGVAVGLDRVVMLAMGVDSLAEVLPFTFQNC